MSKLPSSDSHETKPMPRGRFAGLLVALILLLMGFYMTGTGSVDAGSLLILAGAVIGIMFKALRF